MCLKWTNPKLIVFITAVQNQDENTLILYDVSDSYRDFFPLNTLGLFQFFLTFSSLLNGSGEIWKLSRKRLTVFVQRCVLIKAELKKCIAIFTLKRSRKYRHIFLMRVPPQVWKKHSATHIINTKDD